MGGPDESQFGVIGRGGYLKPLGTTLSNPGNGDEGALQVEWWDNLYRGHAWGIDGAYQETQGKLLPSADFDGNFTANTDYLVYFTGAHMERTLPDGAFYVAGLRTTEARVGFGEFTADPPARNMNGEAIDLDPVRATIFAVERMHKFGVEFRPLPRWPVRLEAGYGTTARLLVDGDEETLTMSSLGIALGVWLSTGLGDDTAAVMERNGLSANDLAFTLYADFGLALVENIARYKFLHRPSALTNNLLKEVTGVEPPSDSEDLPVLQSLALIGDGGPDKIARYADSIDADGHTTVGSHILFGAQLVEAVGYGAAGAKGDLGDHAFLGQGFAGLNRLAVMGMIWNDAPPEWLWAEQLLAGGALMLAAYGVLQASEEWGMGMADGGFRAALGAAVQPDPLRSGFVLRSTYRAMPWSYLMHGGKTGARGFFGIEYDLRVPGGEWLGTGWSISTPFLDAPNLATRAANVTTSAEEDQPLPEAGMPTTIRTEVTFKASSSHDTPVWIEAAIGPHLTTQFAGPATHMGAGLHAQLEIGIRLWSDVALRLGGRVQAALTNDGNELEVTPMAGLTF